MRKDFKFLRVFKNTLFILLCITSLLCQSSYAQNIGGIGAALILDTAGGTTMPRIMSLVPNSPADQNLKATDYIIKVNDVSCKDKTIEEVVAMIRGEAGTQVKITVADTKEGKRPREYDLVRVGLQVAGATNTTPPDPVTAFYDGCEKELQQLRAKHAIIIKTFNSACGNYFFNFEAESKSYHIRIMTMEEKGNGAYTPAFYVTARVFDSNDEAGATDINKAAPLDWGNMMIAQSEGTVTFKKGCVGVVNTQIHDDMSKCHAMFVIVYR